MKDLNNKVAVITGASAGIGRCIAMAMAREGCKVVVVARRQQELDRVVAEIRAEGGRASAMATDLQVPQSIRDTMKAIEQTVGPIDILVNNVGAGTFKPLHVISDAECDLSIQLPYVAAMTATHAVVKGMVKQRSGHIVNMTSPAGIFPLPFMVPYTAGRHAMVGMSHALYEELTRFGIGVSLVCPAQVNTGYFENNDADMSWYPKISSIFPVLEPEMVADAVVDAIRHDRREVVLPAVLKAIVGAFRKTPRMSVHLLSAIGLWGPGRTITDKTGGDPTP